VKPPRSYLVNGALACGVLHFALDLSRSGRTAVDWLVLGLVTLAVVWNLFQLSRRLYAAGGRRELWHLLRTLIFWVSGILGAFGPHTPGGGAWQQGLGWLLLGVAVVDSVALYRVERAGGVLAHR